MRRGEIRGREKGNERKGEKGNKRETRGESRNERGDRGEKEETDKKRNLNILQVYHYLVINIILRLMI